MVIDACNGLVGLVSKEKGLGEVLGARRVLAARTFGFLRKVFLLKREKGGKVFGTIPTFLEKPSLENRRGRAMSWRPPGFATNRTDTREKENPFSLKKILESEGIMRSPMLMKREDFTGLVTLMGLYPDSTLTMSQKKLLSFSPRKRGFSANPRSSGLPSPSREKEGRLSLSRSPPRFFLSAFLP